MLSDISSLSHSHTTDTIMENVTEKMTIATEVSNVWNFLISADCFNACFPSIQMYYKDLKIGETIYFISDSPNQRTVDCAILCDLEPQKKLGYWYVKDHKTHRLKLTFELLPSLANSTLLTLKGENFIDETERCHSQNAWKAMLIAIKHFLEQNTQL